MCVRCGSSVSSKFTASKWDQARGNSVTVSVKGALYRMWGGVNRLGDSGVKVV